jgi:hypothetical protein
MKALIRRVLISLRLQLIRMVFFPYFAVIDWRLGQELKRRGDVISTKTLSETKGGIFCVFHLFVKHRLPASTRRALEALRALNVSIVIVSNGPIPADDVPLLEGLAHTIVIRRNIGRDFGGYRTGVLHVLDTCAPDRLLVVNDSVFFAEKGLAEFFGALCNGGDYVGAAENHEFGYHVGSYALGFGPRVFRHPEFRAFWQNFKLSELRPKVIKTGEIGLNRLVIGRIGAKPEVVFSPRRLGVALNRLSLVDLIDTASRMPGSFPERDALKSLRSTAESWFESADDDGETIGSTRPVDAAAALAGSNSDAVLGLVAKGYRSRLERALMDFVFRGSQIHWGALPFVRHLDCPLIKADLVLRGIYGVGELSGFADLMPEAEFEEFFAMCTRRGVPEQHWGLPQRMLLAVGYI